MSWAGDVGLEEVLAAADRLRRARGGQDLPAWGEPERPAKGGSGRLARIRPSGARLPGTRICRAEDPLAGCRLPDPADRDPATRIRRTMTKHPGPAG